MMIGGYPNEIEIMDRMNQGLELEFQWSYVLYGILTVLVAIGGVYNQYRLKKMKDDFDKGHEYLKALIQANDQIKH